MILRQESSAERWACLDTKTDQVPRQFIMEKKLNDLIESYQEDMIADLKRLVRIPSIFDPDTAGPGAPFGQGARDVLDEVIKISEELGFEAKDYDGYAASVRYGSSGREVGMLCHADVVPVDDNWLTDPFDPVIKDGRRYGRGTVDDKGPLIAAMYAMKAIKESGLELDGHINHIIGCNEETGHECIKYYLTKEKCPDIGFSPDGSFPVIHAEKGIIRYTITHPVEQADGTAVIVKKIVGGTVVNAVPNLAKVWLKGSKEALQEVADSFGGEHAWEDGALVLSFTGVSAHSMQPWLGKNAILPMLAFMKDVNGLSDDAKKFFTSLDSLYADGWEGKNIGIACEDQLSGKLTMNLGVIRFENGISELKVDLRCPVHIDLEQIWKTTDINCQKYGFHPVYWQMRPPLYIPKEAPLVETLLGVYNEMTGEKAEAITIGGGTYCRDVTNFVSFGPVFPYEKELAHEANEFIGIKEFIMASKLYAQALYALLRPEE